MKSKTECVRIDAYYFIRNDETMSDNGRSIKIMETIISFLLMFAPKTLAKRIVAMILLTADVPIPRVVELSGLCERSVRELKRSMAEKDVSEARQKVWKMKSSRKWNAAITIPVSKSPI